MLNQIHLNKFERFLAVQPHIDTVDVVSVGVVKPGGTFGRSRTDIVVVSDCIFFRKMANFVSFNHYHDGIFVVGVLRFRDKLRFWPIIFRQFLRDVTKFILIKRFADNVGPVVRVGSKFQFLLKQSKHDFIHFIRGKMAGYFNVEMVSSLFGERVEKELV